MGPHQSHREIILLAGILLSLAVAGIQAAERPNVLFVIAEGCRGSLGHGVTITSTP
jgi:hypothetical protein